MKQGIFLQKLFIKCLGSDSFEECWERRAAGPLTGQVLHSILVCICLECLTYLWHSCFPILPEKWCILTQGRGVVSSGRPERSHTGCTPPSAPSPRTPPWGPAPRWPMLWAPSVLAACSPASSPGTPPRCPRAPRPGLRLGAGWRRTGLRSLPTTGPAHQIRPVREKCERGSLWPPVYLIH